MRKIQYLLEEGLSAKICLICYCKPSNVYCIAKMLYEDELKPVETHLGRASAFRTYASRYYSLVRKGVNALKNEGYLQEKNKLLIVNIEPVVEDIKSTLVNTSLRDNRLFFSRLGKILDLKTFRKYVSDSYWSRYTEYRVITIDDLKNEATSQIKSSQATIESLNYTYKHSKHAKSAIEYHKKLIDFSKSICDMTPEEFKAGGPTYYRNYYDWFNNVDYKDGKIIVKPKFSFMDHIKEILAMMSYYCYAIPIFNNQQPDGDKSFKRTVRLFKEFSNEELKTMIFLNKTWSDIHNFEYIRYLEKSRTNSMV